MLKIIKDSTLVPTPIVDLKLDSEPRQGSTDPVTSEGVKSAIDGAVGDAAEALQEQIDDIAEKAGSGYIPKGEADVATLNGLSGQENGWLYTMTDAGTLTDGSLAVVAGDTVAWDEANSVWYKAMDYAPAQYGTNEVHNLPTTITAFRTGDVIPVDGPSGTAKMGKDNLLRVTADNAVGSIQKLSISTQTFLDVMVTNGTKVSVKIDPSANGYFSVALGNNDTYTQGGTTQLINAGTPYTFSYVANNDYRQMRINNINGVNAAVEIITEYSVREAVFETRRNAEEIKEIAFPVLSKISGSATADKSISCFFPSGKNFSIAVTNNGASAAYFNGGFYDASGAAISGFSGQLINAGDTYTYNGTLTRDAAEIRIKDTNVVKYDFEVSVTYESIFDMGRNISDLQTRMAGAESTINDLSFHVLSSVKESFSANKDVACYFPTGKTFTLKVTNNGANAGYFSAGLDDKNGVAISGFGGQLINAGDTYTYNGTLTRDAYSLRLRNVNALAAVCELTVNYADAVFDIGKKVSALQNVIAEKYNPLVNVNVINVNADGSADFTDIQSAINSVTDASPTNLYEIRVHSDFKYTTLTDLYKVATYAKNTEANPTELVAAICGKDYVSVVGWGSRKKVEVESPLTIAGTSLQYVQTAYPIGNFTMRNLHLVLTGGRYAIHQESGGNEGHKDNNATTLYENLIIEHKGNEGYPNNWAGQYAMATGTAGNQRIIYRDCTFISRNYQSPFYFHSNKATLSVPTPSEIIMERCHAVTKDGAELTTWDTSKYYPNFGEIGAQARTTITIKDSDFLAFFTSNPGDRGSETSLTTPFKDTKSFMPVIKGCGNKPFVPSQLALKCLCFTSASDGDEVDVVGGTAYDDIWGGTQDTFVGSNAKGISYGKMFIGDPNTLWTPRHCTFTLAYKLGNCADTNKTLIVSVGGVSHTITFDKNYMTADGSAYTSSTTPAYSNDDILAEINTALNGIATATKYSPSIYQSFDDCKQTTKNTSGVSWLPGDCLVLDFSGATQLYRKATAGEKPDAVVLNRIDSGNYGEVFLADKLLFAAGVFGVTGATKGKMYKIGSTGLEVTTTASEAVFVAFTNGFLKKV